MIEKSIIRVDTNLFSEFKDFETVNDDWSIEKHLNFNYNIDDAILFSRLYFPEFIEHKKCIILKERYDKEIFEQWFDEFDGDISKIERMSNLYEVKDLFHINNDNISESKINHLSLLLKKIWQINLDLLFPNRQIKVNVFKEDDDIFITLYSELDDPSSS